MDQDMITLEGTPNGAELLNRIFRALHTIKGSSDFFGFEPVVKLSHRAEDVLNGLRLNPLNRDLLSHRVSPEAVGTVLAPSTARLSFITEELQTSVLKTRMVAVDAVFACFRNLVGREATVVKLLGTYLHCCSAVPGATISGNGRVQLVFGSDGPSEHVHGSKPALISST